MLVQGLDRHAGGRFHLAIPPPWLAEGRWNRHLLPWERKSSAVDRIEQPLSVEAVIAELLRTGHQPSALELLRAVEENAGMLARWGLIPAVERMAKSQDWTLALRGYLTSLIETGNLAQALRGEDVPGRETISTIDLLLQQSTRYRGSEAFQEMIDFMGRFRDYAPFNNMLVRLQNPACSFYATGRDWKAKFGRTLKEDAQPMLILAPMHPVMLVYDLDQTEGDDVPDEIKDFGHFGGEWDREWLERMVENAANYRIRVQFKPLSSTNAGFATMDRQFGQWKMRIVIHDGLDELSRFGALCHELAHILLGHLGSDTDYWWPARTNLRIDAIEVEAEAVAWIVTRRLGLSGGSEAYVSCYMRDGQTPAGVSPDSIAKVAGLLERMARETMPPKRPRIRKDAKK
jgi:hypothetical protein